MTVAIKFIKTHKNSGNQKRKREYKKKNQRKRRKNKFRRRGGQITKRHLTRWARILYLDFKAPRDQPLPFFHLVFFFVLSLSLSLFLYFSLSLTQFALNITETYVSKSHICAQLSVIWSKISSPKGDLAIIDAYNTVDDGQSIRGI